MIISVLLSINGLTDLSHRGFERGFGCYFGDLEGLVYKESLSKKKHLDFPLRKILIAAPEHSHSIKVKLHLLK